ncbi:MULTISPECIES: hypothetical protein [Prochlorococcus]|uniref:hypothetical protein n=1 Tax=Prochlorococcus TaxID=1218 RepID=UPI000ABA8C9C|nr:hypothetical protein [Prochlorococcus marinus]
MSLRPISSVAAKNLIDSCSSAEDEQIAVGYGVSIPLSKFTVLFLLEVTAFTTNNLI